MENKSKEVELNELMREVLRPEEFETKLRFWRIDEILSHDFGEEEWLVDRLLPLQTTTVISGDTNHGKTWITLEIARCVALGIPFLGKFKTIQGPVLMVDEENHLRYIKKRFAQIGIPPSAPVYYLSQGNIKVDDPNNLAMLLSKSEELKAKLIIFDSLVRIHSRDENDAKGIAHVFEKFREFIKAGVNVLVTHHNRKQQGYSPKDPLQSMRGSSDIAAAVDSLLAIKKEGNEIYVCQPKLRVDESIKPFRIEMVVSPDKKSVGFEYRGEVEEIELKKDRAKEIILEVLKDGELARTELLKKVKSVEPIGDNAVSQALHELHITGVITAKSGKKNKKFYLLSTNEET